METLILKNGAEEVESLVRGIMWVLRTLIDKQPGLFYELVMKCRDRQHRFWGDTEERLQRLKLVEANGDVHDSIRNIVLSAVTGDEWEMELASPVVDSA